MKSSPVTISYNKLWKLLIDRGISKTDLRNAIEICPNTMTRMNQGKEVSLSILYKICATLEVDIGDIMEFVDNHHSEAQK